MACRPIPKLEFTAPDQHQKLPWSKDMSRTMLFHSKIVPWVVFIEVLIWYYWMYT